MGQTKEQQYLAMCYSFAGAGTASVVFGVFSLSAGDSPSGLFQLVVAAFLYFLTFGMWENYLRALVFVHRHKVLELLGDGQPHTIEQIEKVVANLSFSDYGLASRILDNFKKVGYIISESRKFAIAGLEDETTWEHVHEITDQGRRELGLPLKSQLPVQRPFPYGDSVIFEQ